MIPAQTAFCFISLRQFAVEKHNFFNSKNRIPTVVITPAALFSSGQSVVMGNFGDCST
jgi:hypothetical protein